MHQLKQLRTSSVLYVCCCSLKQTSFAEFEHASDANWSEIRWRIQGCQDEQALSDHDWFITLEKMQDLNKEDVTAAHARNFLFVHMGLNHFFAGHGKTQPPSVRTSELPRDFDGVAECICVNVPIAELKEKGDCVVLKFDRAGDTAYLEWLQKLSSPDVANVTSHLN